ncbi:hypothetical protein EDD65_10998 [Keratinibaculum paraultunense]|uniref:Lipoprotein n=1 Tax=Keratinibaculum paraultunense TaxID=1278232 RepID=A0A4R3KTZ5_9FIRM|nr:hypothetical protein [Keratinibaculum paraultunense]QQY79454.1 hypothetical protein JL105_09715 [Keratinibaculum paraultunense]TCS88053.1 hypothetical protein EDD65_10998 [Keratinibaculum paraultunense]
MKKRLFSILCIIALSCSILNACGNSDDSSENPTFSYSMNFYQEEFEEEYSHYEKELEVTEDSSEISITGQTSSGKIDIQIINRNGEEEKLYNYSIEGVVDKKITLTDEHSTEWTAIVDCYGDTEGSFKISVK